ncbi:coiled-coil domain-containing protein 10-like protein, partial [Leptotrombidium deliense]
IKCVSLVDQSDRLQEVKYSSNMNMAAKYKLANILTSLCKEMGYKADLGYQTFLYGSDVELRRLLLFLIEKLPKDEIQVSPVADGQETVLQRIKRISPNVVWLPPMIDEHSHNEYFCHIKQLNNILNAKSLVGNKVAPNKRHYYDNFARIPFNDIASIVEWNSHQLHVYLPVSKSKQQYLQKINETTKTNDETVSSVVKNESISEMDIHKHEDVNVVESEDIELQKEKVIEMLEEELDQICKELMEINKESSHQKQLILKAAEIVELETKKLVEMKASDKNIDELKKDIENKRNEIEMLTDQWSVTSNKLLEKIRDIKRENQIKSSESDELNKELKELRKSVNQKSKEIKLKEQAIEELKEKLSTPLPPNRSSYTRRIMEIVNNVKKQNEETKKVLFETRQLQKEINNLSGKVQRSFTITDETIFKDAKSSEWNRKCYKLLATMHENYDQLLEGVNAIGTIKREILQLEEAVSSFALMHLNVQVENEKNNKVVSNLTRIQADLNQMKIENQQIIMKYKALQEQQ